MTTDNIRVTITEDRPKGGMWHTGPNPVWVTATHLPSMQSVTVYGGSQFEARQKALILLEMLTDETNRLPRYPESMEEAE